MRYKNDFFAKSEVKYIDVILHLDYIQKHKSEKTTTSTTGSSTSIRHKNVVELTIANDTGHLVPCAVMAAPATM